MSFPADQPEDIPATSATTTLSIDTTSTADLNDSQKEDEPFNSKASDTTDITEEDENVSDDETVDGDGDGDADVDEVGEIPAAAAVVAANVVEDTVNLSRDRNELLHEYGEDYTDPVSDDDDDDDKIERKYVWDDKTRLKSPWTLFRVPTTIASDADYGLDDLEELDEEEQTQVQKEIEEDMELIKTLSIKANSVPISPIRKQGGDSLPQSPGASGVEISVQGEEHLNEEVNLSRRIVPRSHSLSPMPTLNRHVYSSDDDSAANDSGMQTPAMYQSDSDENVDAPKPKLRMKIPQRSRPMAVRTKPKYSNKLLGRYRVFHEVKNLAKARSVRYAFSDEGQVCIKQYEDRDLYETELEVLQLFKGVPDKENPVAKLIEHHENEEKDEYMIVTELGYGTLRDELNKGKLSLTFGVLAAQLTERLNLLHEKEIVHGNLKPENICLFVSGWKFIDLDFSQHFGERRFDTGNYEYAAPEVVANTTGEAFSEDTTVNPAQDMWAFGVIILECLTGRKIFDGNERAKQRLLTTYKTKRFEYVGQGERDWPYRVARNLLRPEHQKRFSSRDMCIKNAFKATQKNATKITLRVLHVKKQITNKRRYAIPPEPKYTREVYRLSAVFYPNCLKALTHVVTKKEAPHLIALLPKDITRLVYKRRLKKPLRETFQVHLLCEGHGRGADCHLTSHGGFECDVRKGWIRDALPSLRMGLRILSESVYKAPDATRELQTLFADGIELHKHLGLKGHVDYESISDNLEWMGCCLDEFNQLFSSVDINLKKILQQNETKVPRLEELLSRGARSLAGLLKNEDEPNGNLRRLCITEGGRARYVWVCSRHRKAILKRYGQSALETKAEKTSQTKNPSTRPSSRRSSRMASSSIGVKGEEKNRKTHRRRSSSSRSREDLPAKGGRRKNGSDGAGADSKHRRRSSKPIEEEDLSDEDPKPLNPPAASRRVSSRDRGDKNQQPASPEKKKKRRSKTMKEVPPSDTDDGSNAKLGRVKSTKRSSSKRKKKHKRGSSAAAADDIHVDDPRSHSENEQQAPSHASRRRSERRKLKKAQTLTGAISLGSDYEDSTSPRKDIHWKTAGQKTEKTKRKKSSEKPDEVKSDKERDKNRPEIDTIIETEEVYDGDTTQKLPNLKKQGSKRSIFGSLKMKKKRNKSKMGTA